MLVERYPPVFLFAVVPKLLCEFEPVLRELDTLIANPFSCFRSASGLHHWPERMSHVYQPAKLGV